MKPQNRKFWNWINQADADPAEERVLELYGTIAEESWFDDDVTPQMFRDELFAGDGDVVVWINSPGGDCVAASQIYSMLMDYKGNVTVKIDGIAASAASVIAMAGTRVLMAPTALMMIHNPMTAAFGDHEEMQHRVLSCGDPGIRRDPGDRGRELRPEIHPSDGRRQRHHLPSLADIFALFWSNSKGFSQKIVPMFTVYFCAMSLLMTA
nr:MAG TPA: Putative ATP dependent Clp protease [Caudoviricetes sp.]